MVVSAYYNCWNSFNRLSANKFLHQTSEADPCRRQIRFFTNMAHDIRTSLTLINAPIEELNKERNLSESGHYYLNLATEQSDRLTFVATQLLDIQK